MSSLDADQVQAAFATLKPGHLVRFAEERLRYRVRACNARFAVCTKPFNPRRTVLYSIIDIERGVRGRENLIFGMGFETDQECAEALERLEAGETEVSYRHYIPLDITAISIKAR